MENITHRTNVVLNEALIQEALELSQLKTKRAVIDAALKEFVANHKQPDIRELFGSKPFYEGYDYKALRINPHLPDED